MNEEESKAIYRLNFHKENAGIANGMVIVNKADVETVLNMLEKKDKIINLMGEKLTNFTATCIDTDGTVTLADKEDIKEYFERKVENKIQEEN